MKRKNKLTLHRETLVQLDRARLMRAAGGWTYFGSCVSLRKPSPARRSAGDVNRPPPEKRIATAFELNESRIRAAPLLDSPTQPLFQLSIRRARGFCPYG